MAQAFRERLQNLRDELDRVVSSNKSCIPALAVLGVVVPLVLWAVLYFAQFSFVMDEDSSNPKDRSRSAKKMGCGRRYHHRDLDHIVPAHLCPSFSKKGNSVACSTLMNEK